MLDYSCNWKRAPKEVESPHRIRVIHGAEYVPALYTRIASLSHLYTDHVLLTLKPTMLALKHVL
jgi:hypothetical protein